MFSVCVETEFQASHQLTLPDGKTEPLHSHNWRVVVEVGSKQLDSMGLVMDFHRLKSAVSEIVNGLDKLMASRTDFFRLNNPSAENVARYIYQVLEQKLPASVRLLSVYAQEEPGCRGSYSRI